MQVENVIRDIRDFLGECVTMLEDGKPVNMQGLDHRIQTLCQSIEAMPREEAKAYEQDLTVLFSQLELVEKLLREARDELGELMQKNIPLQRKAHVAYMQSDSYDPKNSTRQPRSAKENAKENNNNGDE